MQRIQASGPIFLAFLRLGLTAFGGPIAHLEFFRREFVERRGWLSAQAYGDLVALCQFLPGPNIVNLAAAFGARHRGVSGAFAAVTGLLAAPVVIVITLGLLFERYGHLPLVHHGIEGLAAAASGLILATALKIAGPSLRVPSSLAMVAIAFVLFAILHLKLPVVIALALP
ncbi:MAG: chromate transporter, partial [Thiomonas sp.]